MSQRSSKAKNRGSCAQVGPRRLQGPARGHRLVQRDRGLGIVLFGGIVLTVVAIVVVEGAKEPALHPENALLEQRELVAERQRLARQQYEREEREVQLALQRMADRDWALIAESETAETALEAYQRAQREAEEQRAQERAERRRSVRDLMAEVRQLVADGNDSDALLLCNRALERAPEHQMFLHARAVIFMHLQRWADALTDCDRAVELDPTLTRAWVTRGNAHRRAGMLKAALADYNRALELDPSYTTALNNRARIFTEQGDDATAVTELTRAIEIGQVDPVLFLNRGSSRERLGDKQGAIDDYLDFLANASTDLLVKRAAVVDKIRTLGGPSLTLTPNGFSYVGSGGKVTTAFAIVCTRDSCTKYSLDSVAGKLVDPVRIGDGIRIRCFSDVVSGEPESPLDPETEVALAAIEREFPGFYRKLMGR